jgi:hypothetical protein
MVATLPSAKVARKTTPASNEDVLELAELERDADPEVKEARPNTDCDVNVEPPLVNVVAEGGVSCVCDGSRRVKHTGCSQIRSERAR